MTGAVLLDVDKPFEHFVGVNPFPRTVRKIHGWVQSESERGIVTEVLVGAVLAVTDGFSPPPDDRAVSLRGSGCGLDRPVPLHRAPWLRVRG